MKSRVNIFNALLVFFSISCIVLGTWGWLSVELAYKLTFWDALYRSITAFALSDTYEYGYRWSHDWRLELARWFGLMALAVGTFKALAFVLSSSWLKISASRRKGHVLVVGDDPFAESIVKELIQAKKEINWINAPEVRRSDTKQVFIEQGRWSLSTVEQLGLLKAEKVVIAMQEDAKSITTAREIRQKVPDENQLKVFVTIQNPWIALSIDDLDGLKGIQMFSRPQAAARAVHRKHPPFLIASNAKQARIHAVIFGLNRHGEAVLIDILLYCLTSNLSKPKITIIDKHADKLENQLKLRYPEIHKSADLQFVIGELQGNESTIDEEQIKALGAESPITCAYICLGNDDETLSSGLELRAVTLRNQLIEGPIFLRLINASAIKQTQAGVSHLEVGQLVAYGSLDSMVDETGILSKDVDVFPKLIHSNYQKIAQDTIADVSWDALPEDKKDSNRRQVLHLFAKLASSGYDIEPFIKKLESTPNINDLPYAPSFADTDEKVESLAILEHERWMADRRVNGWQYDPIRDDARKRHPDLIPFEQLSETSKSYDRDFVIMMSWLLSIRETTKN